MTRNRNITTICIPCKGRGWHDKKYPHPTIESVMPHGEHAYMCSSCRGSGIDRMGGRRIVLGRRWKPSRQHVVGPVDRNSIWRIYCTSQLRIQALVDIIASLGRRPFYVMDWKDVNGYGLHIVKTEVKHV